MAATHRVESAARNASVSDCGMQRNQKLISRRRSQISTIDCPPGLAPLDSRTSECMYANFSPATPQLQSPHDHRPPVGIIATKQVTDNGPNMSSRLWQALRNRRAPMTIGHLQALIGSLSSQHCIGTNLRNCPDAVATSILRTIYGRITHPQQPQHPQQSVCACKRSLNLENRNSVFVYFARCAFTAEAP